MGNMVTDAMREKYPGIDAAFTNSGGLVRTSFHAAERRRAAGRDHLGRDVRRPTVRQQDDDPHADGRAAPGSVRERVHAVLLPGFAGGTGRFPQISGLKVQFHCNGNIPVIDAMWKTPNGIAGPATPIGPADPVRFVTNDFMYGGGDGYTVFAQGTNVLQPGDDLLQVSIDYVTAHSPVDPHVEGRIVEP